MDTICIRLLWECGGGRVGRGLVSVGGRVGRGGRGGHRHGQRGPLAVKHLEDQLGVCSGRYRYRARLQRTPHEYQRTFLTALRDGRSLSKPHLLYVSFTWLP